MSDRCFEQIDVIFRSLGRALLIVDDTLKIVQAGTSFDHLVCPGAARRVIGQSAEHVFHSTMPRFTETLLTSLRHGNREEGRRAFLQCPQGTSRLISLTIAPIEEPWPDLKAINGTYALVIRPAEDEALMLERAIHSKGMVARSVAMQKIAQLVEALNQSVATVLLTGESGTGKEVVARAIHYHSPHRNGPFVAINCTALPEQLLENELFGHIKGAYTGAHANKAGKFESARDGTLFLDEIGDMPMSLQVKLLRVIQERVFERLGDTVQRKLSARIIAATNMNLEEGIARGTFRDDLYYRLKVIPIHIPPLRDRTRDIEVLAKYLLQQIAARMGKNLFIPSDTMQLLTHYPWPGNVRELENAMEHAATFCQGQFIHIDHLPESILNSRHLLQYKQRLNPKPTMTMGDPEIVEEGPPSEVDRLRSALEQFHWNKGQAAKALGISRTTLWRKMKQNGLA